MALSKADILRLSQESEKEVFEHFKKTLDSSYEVYLNPMVEYKEGPKWAQKENEICDVLIIKGSDAYAVEVKTRFSDADNAKSWVRKYIHRAMKQTYTSVRSIPANSVSADEFGVGGSKYSWHLITILNIDENKVYRRTAEERRSYHKRKYIFVSRKILLMSELLDNNFSSPVKIMNFTGIIS